MFYRNIIRMKRGKQVSGKFIYFYMPSDFVQLVIKIGFHAILPHAWLKKQIPCNPNYKGKNEINSSSFGHLVYESLWHRYEITCLLFHKQKSVSNETLFFIELSGDLIYNFKICIFNLSIVFFL